MYTRLRGLSSTIEKNLRVSTPAQEEAKTKGGKHVAAGERFAVARLWNRKRMSVGEGITALVLPHAYASVSGNLFLPRSSVRQF